MNSSDNLPVSDADDSLMDHIDKLAKSFNLVHQKYLTIQNKFLVEGETVELNNAVNHQLGNMMAGVYTEEALIAAEHFMIAYEDVVDYLDTTLNSKEANEMAIAAAHTVLGVMQQRASKMYDKEGKMIGSDAGRRELVEYIFKTGGFKIDTPEIVSYLDELAPKDSALKEDGFIAKAGNASRASIFNLLALVTPATNGKRVSGQHIELDDAPEVRALHILGDYAGHLYYYWNSENVESQKAVKLFSSAYETYIMNINNLIQTDNAAALAKIHALSNLLANHTLPLTQPEDLLKYIFTEAGCSLSNNDVEKAIPLILKIKE